jgi:hypothetical protein
MEQENQSTQKTETERAQTTSAANQSADAAADTNMNPNANTNTNESEQSLDQLMQGSPMLSPLAGWLKCLRKPALSVEYSLQKRHVPDLDREGGQNKKSGGNTSAGTASSDSPTPRGKNSDVMGVNGSFTIRYFDFALGIMGLAIAGFLTKGCCCLKRKMF